MACSVNDVANVFHVNQETVRRWIRDGKLDAVRGSGRNGNRISVKAIRQLLGEMPQLETPEVHIRLQALETREFSLKQLNDSVVARPFQGVNRLPGETRPVQAQNLSEQAEQANITELLLENLRIQYSAAQQHTLVLQQMLLIARQNEQQLQLQLKRLEQLAAAMQEHRQEAE